MVKWMPLQSAAPQGDSAASQHCHLPLISCALEQPLSLSPDPIPLSLPITACVPLKKTVALISLPWIHFSPFKVSNLFFSGPLLKPFPLPTARTQSPAFAVVYAACYFGPVPTPRSIPTRTTPRRHCLPSMATNSFDFQAKATTEIKSLCT